MFLGTFRGEWVIVYGNPRYGQRYSLRVRPAAGQWALEHGFVPHGGTVYSRNASPGDDLTWYVTIRYRGCDVQVWGWHETSTEPILEIYSSWLDPKTYYPIDTPKTVEEFFARIRAEGWMWDHYTGGLKYVHVDELEKLEGPVPDGTF